MSRREVGQPASLARAIIPRMATILTTTPVPEGSPTTLMPAPPVAVRTQSIALGIVAVALLAVAAYASTPFNFWVGDDYNYLGPKSIDRVISFFDPTLRAFYRPLNWTSWALDYA